MSSEYDRCAAIIVCLRVGRTAKEIIKFTKLPKSTTYDVAKAFNYSDGSGTPARRIHDQSECKKCFQQDPAHTSLLVKNWCSDNLDMLWSKEMWPPSSPNLNPLDYYMWGILERESNKRAHM